MQVENSCFIFSNQIEVLVEALQTALFAPNKFPFQKRIVVVPSPAIKSCIMQTIAKEKGVAAGIEFCFLRQAIQTLSDTFFSGSGHLPSRLELELKIQSVICQKLHNSSKSEETLLHPLRAHLKIDSKSNKSCARLLSLSKQLAQLFFLYGMYGKEWIMQWSRFPPQGWQQLLWQEIFSCSWTFPVALLQNSIFKEQASKNQTEIHLFALSFLSPWHLRFFLKLSQKIPLYGYFPSPSLYFWSDIASDRQRISMQKWWQKQQVPHAIVNQMEDILLDTNPLLSNLGRMGRKLFAAIEETQPQIIEKYILPANIENHALYKEMYCDNIAMQSKKTLSILTAIQTDLLLLRNPMQKEKIVFDRYDRSIQIHMVPSPLHEVQILHSNLLYLLHESAADGQEPLNPSDIIVISPNIEKYIPYIHAVFQAEKPFLPYHIFHPKSSASNSILASLFCLFDLALSRWDTLSVFKFLEQLPVQRRFGWTAQEIHQLAKWTEEANIRWGSDTAHRNSLLRQAYCSQNMLEESTFCTWQHGLHQLLMGLCIETSQQQYNDVSDDFFLSNSKIDFTQATLLGQFIEIFHSLQKDLDPIQNNSTLCIETWTEYIENLLCSYFAIDESDAKENGEMEIVQQMLLQLHKAAGEMGRTQFDFQSVLFQLQQLAQETEEIAWNEQQLQSIRFGSLFAMHLVPAKVLYLLGMDKDQYPRAESYHTLNCMQHNTSQTIDAMPIQIDQDRYIFLEALLSARQYFIASYVHTSSDNHAPQQPCTMLHEILTYLQEAVIIEGKNGKQSCLFHHPEYSFHSSYFSPSHLPFTSFSENSYLAAQAMAQKAKKTYRRLPHYFDAGRIQEKTIDVSSLPSGYIDIEARHLLQATSDPLKLYCHNVLKLFLSSAEHVLKEEEDFYLSALQFTILKREALRLGTKKVLQKAQQWGQMPLGPFKKVLCSKLEREVAQLEYNLQKLDVSNCAIGALELTPFHTAITQEDAGDWTAPAITFAINEHTSVRITGTLHDITAKGLVLYGKPEYESYLKAWPTLLLLTVLDPQKKHWQTDMLFAQTGTQKEWHLEYETACAALKNYVLFYILCTKQPVALLPAWIESISNGNQDQLQKQLLQTLGSGWGSSYSPYIKWAFQENDLPPANVMINMWQKPLQQTYGSMPQALKGMPLEPLSV